MEKRYQVFISSTFQDLQNARQEVSQALLRADCFPAGMELFPAADEEQFEFIKTIIDQSDYYILISAGRYGSIHPETGLSYTEMEYDYAVETGKPIIRLLHKDPTSLDNEDDGRLAKLMSFRERLKANSMVAFWDTPDQLGKEVAYSLFRLRTTKPGLGWIRPSDIQGESFADHSVKKLGVSYSEIHNLLQRRENWVALFSLIIAILLYRELRGNFDWSWYTALPMSCFTWVFLFSLYLADKKQLKIRLKTPPPSAPSHHPETDV